MTTTSQIPDEAGDGPTCPRCHGSGETADSGCALCNGYGRVPKPKAEQPSADIVERVAKALHAVDFPNTPAEAWGGRSDSTKSLYWRRARAALSPIPQPAEVVGPAWRDKPDAEGWWLSQPATGPSVWFQAADEAHGIIYTPEELARLPFVARWFGPVRIPDDKVGA